MAARKNTVIHEQARQAIQTTQLVKRLTYHALGIVDPSHKALNINAPPVEMSATQVSAATALLRKVLPDLASTDLHVKGQLEQHIIGLVTGLDMREDTVPSPTSTTSKGETIN